MLLSPGKMSLLPLAILVFLAFTLEFSISPAAGLKCYECQNCSYPINATNCRPANNRCEKVEEEGAIWRHCSTVGRQLKFEKEGYQCDDFDWVKDSINDLKMRSLINRTKGPIKNPIINAKRCYCDTDYCNQAPSLLEGLPNLQLMLFNLIIIIFSVLIFHPA